MKKRIRLKFKNTQSTVHERIVDPMHNIKTTYIVGIGFPITGTRTNASRSIVHKPRRVLRIRSVDLQCSYVFVSEPDKGKIVPSVRGWVPVTEVEREYALRILGRELKGLE